MAKNTLDMPKTPKHHQKHPKHGQTPQKLPKTPQTLPNTLQTWPKRAQTLPKTAQTLPKTPQTLPSISTSISIRKVSMIYYHEFPYEIQTEMIRGPLAEDEHSIKEIEGGRLAGLRPAGRPPTISFMLCSSSARGPLDIPVCISYGDSW